jgi:hypothetical protein
MDKLIELLQQIQELAGVAVDALKGAGGEHGQPHEGGGQPHPGGGQAPGAPDKVPDGDEGGKPPFGR